MEPESKSITFKGTPIHICDKAPKDKPYLIPNNINICPFCRKNLKNSEKFQENK